MTTLQLDVPQRVNIVAMLDAVECPGRRETWAVCRLQEQLSLTDEERAAIGWRKIIQDGREYAIWQSNIACEARDYELSDDDIARLCRAVDQFRVVLGRDRAWWEPLTRQLPAPPEPALQAMVNGAGSR